MKSTVAFVLILLGVSSAAPGGEHGYSGGGKRECSQAEVALAAGIHLNINAQYGEYNGTLAVEKAEQQHPRGPSKAFYVAKGALQADIQEGQNIRLFNQQIAPPGNPAIAGLQQYAAAQETEKAQAAGLTGHYKKDKPTFDKLKTEIMMGIELNQNNLKAAVSECDFTLQFPPENEMGS